MIYKFHSIFFNPKNKKRIKYQLFAHIIKFTFKTCVRIISYNLGSYMDYKIADLKVKKRI